MSDSRTAFITRLARDERLLLQPVSDVNGAAVVIDERNVLNFASTNYLALNRHPYVVDAVVDAVNRWGVSLSMPRILADDPLNRKLERMLAALVQQETALIFPSTTHIAIDLLPRLTASGGTLFVDRWAYPISLEGARLAQQRGGRIVPFSHNDVDSLAHLLARRPQRSATVIVCDGVYAADGMPAPLADFVALAARHNAVVYVDDAHGLGVLGRSPNRRLPYGFGGGGTVLYSRTAGPNIIHVGSLSKAFGVPLAFVAGAKELVEPLRTEAGSMVHSSPPALPVLAAAWGVLRAHIACGEPARRHLLHNVIQLRRTLLDCGLPPAHSHLFPIQTLHFDDAREAVSLAGQLRRQGVWPLLQLAPTDNPGGAAIRFVLTAQHTRPQINRVGALIRQIRPPS